MHKKSGDRRVSSEEKENEQLPGRELSCTGLLQFLDLGAEGSKKAPGEKQVLHETSPGCSSSSQDRKKAGRDVPTNKTVLCLDSSQDHNS